MQCCKPFSVNQIIVSHTQISKTSSSGHNNIQIKTLNGCKLNISHYSFLYNAEGGRGTGSYVKIKDDEAKCQVPLRYNFDLETVHIPPLTSTTTQLEGWNLFPPFVKVDIVPESIQGNIYEESGKVELKFKSKFLVYIGGRYAYQAPPLPIDMIFTTEELKGALTKGTQGKRMDKDGKCKLVGVARVDPVDDNYINIALGLPSECFASLKAIISFS